MAEPIVITITDSIAATIGEKLDRIAAGAVSAHEALVALQEGLSTLNVASLGSAATGASDLASAMRTTATVSREAATAVTALNDVSLSAALAEREYAATIVDKYKATLNTIAAEQQLANTRLAAQLTQDGINASLKISVGLGRDYAATVQAIARVEGELAAAQEQVSRAALAEIAAMERSAATAAQAAADYQSLINANLGVGRSTGITAEEIGAFGLALDELRAKFNPLFAAEQRHIAFLAELDRAFAVGAISVDEYSLALTRETATYDAAIAKIKSTTVALDESTAALERSTVAVQAASAPWGAFVGTLAAFFAANEVVHAVDNYTRLTNAIRVAGLTGQAAADQFNFLTDVAERNGVRIDTLALLYQRLGVAQAVAGLNTERMNKLLTVLTQSFRVQALDAAHITNTIRDFNDIVESGGTTFTRFFNNLQRADFALVAASAKGLNISIHELDEGIRAGTIDSKEFVKGIIDGAGYMQTLADATNLTVSGSLNNLQTAFTKLVSSTDQATGAVALLARGIQFLADNLPLVATAVLAFGAAWAVIGIKNLIVDVYGLAASMVAFATAAAPAVLEVVAAATPFLLLAAAIAIVGAVMLAVTGQTDNFVNSIKSLAASAVDALGINKLPQAIQSMTGVSNDAIAKLAGLQNSLGEVGSDTTALGDKTKTTAESYQELIANLNKTQISLDGVGKNATTAGNSLRHYASENQNGTVIVDELSAGVYRLSGDYDVLADATDAATAAAVSWGKATTSVITTADGSTASLVTYKDNLDGVAASLDRVTSAAERTVSSLADLGPGGPDIITLGAPTSTPDITTLGPSTSSPSIVTAPAFATGGSFTVGGRAGTDRNKVSFWATQGERVDVLTPDQQRRQREAAGGRQVTINAPITIVTPDANSFRKSRAQVARDLGNILAAGHSNG